MQNQGSARPKRSCGSGRYAGDQFYEEQEMDRYRMQRHSRSCSHAALIVYPVQCCCTHSCTHMLVVTAEWTAMKM
jgi:hypothetical protein